MLPNFWRRSTLIFASILLIVVFLWTTVNGVLAANIPSNLLGWQYDQQVTEVGKNAERARQLVYWMFTHSPSYTVPVFVQIWTISRNIVFVMFILIIAFTGLSYILSKQNDTVGPVFSGIASPIFGMTIPTLFFKIGMLLLYVVFSFVIILGLIQSSEVFSRFFAERYYGCDLFNVRFSGGGSRCEFSPEKVKEMEANYTDFIGYRDPNPLNQEAASTSLFLVRLTSLTYNLFAVVLVFRQVILWFLLMVSPFLALLLPFIFIRNTGWIWIGVFFQWLFYGPLVSLFLAGLVLIWRLGIPYPFDFSRVNQTNGQIFPTSVNILYGGPGQLLSPTNSANYVDTYAEYIIALIMLWTCLFLPWLLLRIFRDYCCDILRQNQAVLLSILDKMRGLGPPTPPPVPGGVPTTQTGVPFAFRKTVEEVKKTSIDRLKEISKVNTSELTRSLSLSVSTLTEVAHFEMNRKEQDTRIHTLNNIANPQTIAKTEDRARFESIRKELETRANAGDRMAQRVLSASLRQPGQVTPVPIPREFAEIKEHEAYNTLTKVSQLSTEKIREIIRDYRESTHETSVGKISVDVNVPESKVAQVVSALPAYAPFGTDATQVLAEHPTVASEIARNTGLSEDKVREIVRYYSQVTLTESERMENIARQSDLPVAAVTKILQQILQSSTDTKADISAASENPQIFSQIIADDQVLEKVAHETGIAREKIKNVVEQVVAMGPRKVKAEDSVELVSQKSNVPKDKIKGILANLAAARLERTEEGKPKIARKTSVSVEDYEEVKNMWVNHYRLSEVPVSDEIKTRSAWLTEDERVLTNALDMLTSLNPADKGRGMKQVAAILPFLLLGGFSEVETVLYLKAKLAAAKQVQEELEQKEQTKEEVLKEEEETLLEVPKAEKKEEVNEMKLEEEMKIPSKEEKNKGVLTSDTGIGSVNSQDKLK